MTIQSLEGLRGIAALLVALYHFKIGASLMPAVRHGYLFVDLFFVLSGFVIASAYSGRLGTARQAGTFMLRRFGRLFPLLVLSTALFVVAQNGIVFLKTEMVARGMAGVLRNPEDLAYHWPTTAEILSTLTMTHAMGVHDRLVMNFVSWSISVEFWSYALFAALMLTVPLRLRTMVFAALAAAMYMVTIWASIGPHRCLAQGDCLALTYDFGYPRCLASFFLGVLVWQLRDLGRAGGGGTAGCACSDPAVVRPPRPCACRSLRASLCLRTSDLVAGERQRAVGSLDRRFPWRVVRSSVIRHLHVAPDPHHGILPTGAALSFRAGMGSAGLCCGIADRFGMDLPVGGAAGA